MMDTLTEYQLEYKPREYQHRENIRKYVLALGVLMDICAIATIMPAIIAPIYLLATLGIIALRTAITMLINRYPTKYTYVVIGDRLVITKITPSKNTLMLDKALSDIVSLKAYITDEVYENDKIDIILYDNSCKISPYVLKFSDKSCILPLDEYMYTLIKDGMNG